MAKPNKQTATKNNGNFEKSYIKYDTMNQREKNIFLQGCATANNSVKEKLGLKKPRN